MSKFTARALTLAFTLTTLAGAAGTAEAGWPKISKPSMPKLPPVKVSAPKLPPVKVTTTPRLPKPGPFQQKLGQGVAAGAAGGAASGAAFGSFAGPAGTAAGAYGGAVAGGVSGGVTTTVKNHGQKHWGWKK